MQQSVRIPTIVFLIFLSVVMGCHQGRAKQAGFPALQSCRLTFTQEGQPVVAASVTLYSTDPAFKWSIGGFTDAKGEVVLKTNGFFEGIPIGEYKVTLQKIVREGPPLPDESQLPEDEAARAKIS